MHCNEEVTERHQGRRKARANLRWRVDTEAVLSKHACPFESRTCSYHIHYWEQFHDKEFSRSVHYYFAKYFTLECIDLRREPEKDKVTVRFRIRLSRCQWLQDNGTGRVHPFACYSRRRDAFFHLPHYISYCFRCFFLLFQFDWFITVAYTISIYRLRHYHSRSKLFLIQSTLWRTGSNIYDVMKNKAVATMERNESTDKDSIQFNRHCEGQEEDSSRNWKLCISDPEILRRRALAKLWCQGPLNFIFIYSVIKILIHFVLSKYEVEEPLYEFPPFSFKPAVTQQQSRDCPSIRSL